MPELPEVETTVKGLNETVIKKTIKDVWTDWGKAVKKPAVFDNFKKQIIGKKILKSWRRGKNVIMDLSDNYSLLIHQKMTGHLLFGEWELKNNKWIPKNSLALSDPMNRFIHLIFFFSDNTMLALSDLRKFAKVELWKKEELLKELEKIGPEPLEIDFERFKELLLNKKGKVKQVLMKPEIIAGIGNIYSDEALWTAKIHPEKDVSKLNDKELKDLYEAILKVLKLGVKLGGESFSDYRKIDGSKGDFDDEKKAYKREGEKCFRCKNIIKRIKVGGRSACFCPVCQRLS